MNDQQPDGYDPSAYPPFAVTVDVALLTVRDGLLQMLLVERGNDPYAGAWALPGGFVNVDEDVEDAASRELAEETGVTRLPSGFYLEQLRTYGAPDRDPRMRVVSVGYVALTPPPADEPAAGSDATMARWWPVKDLGLGLFDNEPDDDGPALAFDHARIVADAVERARAKLEYTTVATSFLSEPFTLADLRRVYEAVWSAALHPSNFRRKVMQSHGFVVEDTGREIPPGGGPPAKLYRAGDAVLVHPPLLRPEPGQDHTPLTARPESG
jgi:8-oxo-dGTP diphosphatase